MITTKQENGILALKEEYMKRLERLEELAYYNTDQRLKLEFKVKSLLLSEVVKDLEELLK